MENSLKIAIAGLVVGILSLLIQGFLAVMAVLIARRALDVAREQSKLAESTRRLALFAGRKEITSVRRAVARDAAIILEKICENRKIEKSEIVDLRTQILEAGHVLNEFEAGSMLRVSQLARIQREEMIKFKGKFKYGQLPELDGPHSGNVNIMRLNSSWVKALQLRSTITYIRNVMDPDEFTKIPDVTEETEELDEE